MAAQKKRVMWPVTSHANWVLVLDDAAIRINPSIQSIYLSESDLALCNLENLKKVLTYFSKTIMIKFMCQGFWNHWFPNFQKKKDYSTFSSFSHLSYTLNIASLYLYPCENSKSKVHFFPNPYITCCFSRSWNISSPKQHFSMCSFWNNLHSRNDDVRMNCS